MKRLLLSITLATGLMASASTLAQDDPLLDEEEEAQQEAVQPRPFDPRASSLDEAMEPTSADPSQDAQDFFDSFNEEEDEQSLDDFLLGDEETETGAEINTAEEQLLDDNGEVIEGEAVDGELADTGSIVEEEVGPEVELPTRTTFNPFDFEETVDDPITPIPDADGISRVAVIRGLDKITARVRDVEVPVGRPVMFERFEILVQACSRRPPEETPETTAFLEITEHQLNGNLTPVFTGWMFASTPGLNPVEHPVYDVWLIDCRTL